MMTRAASLIAAGLFGGLLAGSQAEAASPPNNIFDMIVSPGAAGCLPHAFAQVAVTSLGPVENMHVIAVGLPPNTGFDFFVIQAPNFPFGLSWYMGDLETDGSGVAIGDFVGRFSKETFIVAPGVTAAPVEHFPGQKFSDADKNPATAPVQTYHLGVWFDSPAHAAAAGCPAAATPFNGEHDAGIQVLNTANFPQLAGPLLRIE